MADPTWQPVERGGLPIDPGTRIRVRLLVVYDEGPQEREAIYLGIPPGFPDATFAASVAYASAIGPDWLVRYLGAITHWTLDGTDA